MGTQNKKGAAGADARVREFNDPKVLGLRRAVAGVVVELRSRAVDEIPGAADRLEASVVRPLDDLVADGATEPHPAAGSRQEVQSIADRLVQLAKAATRLRARPGAAPALVEATAALQDVALRLAVSDDAAAGLRGDFQKLQRRLPTGIQVSANGPYLVTNATKVFTNLGERMVVGPQTALCRCGASALKPLCDGTHARIGFSGARDPARVPDRRDTYVGEQVTIFDNRGICAHSGFCTDRVASAFHTGGGPFVSPSGARMDELIRAVRDCPSGALSFAVDGREAREYVDQGVREPAIEVSKDGPYRVTGGAVLTDENGDAVARVEGASFEHYSLCRCGQSQNKPFCSGRHWYVGFRDPPLSAEPSLFESVGGLPALTRLVRRVLEKHVPEDEFLAPLFADMAPDLPRRAAAWLGEAFGGPAAEDAVSLAPSLAGGAITEEQRQRAVALFERSADEVGLPADPQFRAAFVSYLECVSRAVVEATQQGADPSAALQSARKWDWTAAGKPAFAAPAPGADGAEDALPPSLPGVDEPILFDEHIKALFRASDRDAMRWAFDLWSYNDVVANAQAILQRLEAGSMPCDGAWAPEKVEVFRRWVDEGSAESATPAAAPQVLARADEPTAAPEPIGGRLGSLVKLRTDSPEGDRPLVIEHREPLIYMLCSAAELEHALMCEYLFAAFTLKRSVDEGLTEDQLAAVERWRAALLVVAKQEMLHLAINCNLVNSLGASPHLSRPNLPQPAKHYPPGVILTLLPFSEEALRHFIYLERPEGMDFDDAEGLAAFEGAAPVMGPEEIAPHLQEFATVGHLYRSIEAGFRHLGEKLGEDNLFVASATEQVSGDLFGWPQLEPITNVDGAVRAIETIVEQGEGPRGDWRNAHFGRFLRVLDEYLSMMQANPGLEVARPVLPVLVRPPENGAEADLITDPGTAGVADLCNVGYEVLLQLLYRLLCHVDESDAQMKTLSQVAIRLMFDVIEPICELLTTLPVGPERPGRTAGPSFELFYQPDYLLPHRDAAWRIMAEHLADAGALAQQQADREPRLLPISRAFQRLAETLRS
jgi:CDGSH-type Zn-finger protein/truncated hemoglobin YjbI